MSGDEKVFISMLERMGWKRVWDKIYAVLLISSRPLTMKELANRTGYSLSSLSTNLRILLRLKLITRAKKKGVYVYRAVKRMVEVYQEQIRLFIETELVPLQKRIHDALKVETHPDAKKELKKMLEEMNRLKDYFEFQLNTYPRSTSQRRRQGSIS